VTVQKDLGIEKVRRNCAEAPLKYSSKKEMRFRKLKGGAGYIYMDEI
jgi:hypothetical protein